MKTRGINQRNVPNGASYTLTMPENAATHAGSFISSLADDDALHNNDDNAKMCADTANEFGNIYKTG